MKEYVMNLFKRGGTFWYCLEVTETTVPKLDKNGRKTRYTTTVTTPCTARFRTFKRLERHRARHH